MDQQSIPLGSRPAPVRRTPRAHPSSSPGGGPVPACHPPALLALAGSTFGLSEFTGKVATGKAGGLRPGNPAACPGSRVEAAPALAAWPSDCGRALCPVLGNLLHLLTCSFSFVQLRTASSGGWWALMETGGECLRVACAQTALPSCTQAPRPGWPPPATPDAHPIPPSSDSRVQSRRPPSLPREGTQAAAFFCGHLRPGRARGCGAAEWGSSGESHGGGWSEPRLREATGRSDTCQRGGIPGASARGPQRPSLG